MTEGSRLDPMLLSAWVDQELDATDQARVEARLAANPAEAELVRRWKHDRDALQARLAPLADEPLPDSLLQLLDGTRRESWRRAALAASLLIAGGALGAGAMWGVMSDRALHTAEAPVEWVHRAAVAHAVYAPEVRHPVEVKAQEEHLARWLTRRLAMPVKLFDLREQGFDLVGGRLLPDVDAPGAQLMYQNAAGQRVTVYLRKPDAATPAAFRFEKHGELALFYWVDGPTGYALVGPLPREQLLAMAESVYRQGQAPISPAAPAAPPPPPARASGS